MSHVRQQIREAAATALSGNTQAGTRVYSSLVYPTSSSDLPLVHVRVDSEESDLAGVGGLLQRIANVVVTAVDDAEESALDNALDTLAAEIEAQLGGNTFSGISKQTVLTSTEVNRSGDGATPVASIALTFQVTYHTDDGDAETAL